MNPAIQRIKNRKLLRFTSAMLAAGPLMVLTGSALAGTTYSGSFTGTAGANQNYTWSNLTFTTGATTANVNDTYNITLTANNNTTNLTSGLVGLQLEADRTVSVMSITANNAFDWRFGSDASRKTVTFDNGTSVATLNVQRNVNNMLRFFFDANMALNSNLNTTFTRLNTGNESGITGVISGTGKLTLAFTTPSSTSGAGTFSFGPSAQAQLAGQAGTTSAANTFSGGLSITGFNATTYSFIARKANAFGTGAVELATARLDLNGFAQTIGGLAGGAGSANVTDRTNSAGTTALTLDFATGTQTFTGSVNNGSVNASRLLSVTKKGAGTQVFNGTNGYTGNTSIEAGTLQFGRRTALYNAGAGAAWTTANLIQVSSGATLGLNVGGTNEFTSSDVDTLQGLGGLASGARLGLDTTNAAGGEFIHTGNIGGSIGLTKLGTGKLTLNGTNTYTGTTQVSGGTLAIGATGTLSGTTNINLATGTTLDVTAAGFTLGVGQSITGNGTVLGTLISNGTLAAGNSIGTINFDALTVNGALNVELDGNTNLADLYNVTGLLTIGNGATLNFSQLNPVTGGAYIFAKYGSWNGQQFTTINGTPSGWTIDYNYNDGSSTNNFALVAVPEPGAIALSMLGGLLLFGRRKRS